MTFTQIKAAIKDYCLLTSAEADTRVGTAINRHYRRITSQLGMDATRFVTRTQATTPGGQTVTFTAIEKIDRVLDTTELTTRRLLGDVSLHALRAVQPGTGPPTQWALQNTDATAVTILLDTQPAEARSLQADGWTTLADLSGEDAPVFPESFHDVLVWFVIAEELLKKEKLQLAGTYDQKAEKLLADLRFHLADSPLRETRQADPRVSALVGGGGGGAGGGGGLTEHAPTHEAGGSDPIDLGSLAGVITLAQLVSHAATHETGGSDALTALDAGILTSGTLPDARFPAVLPAVSGVNLTNLNATNVTSGTLPDARLSSQVVLENISNTFAIGNQGIVHSSAPNIYFIRTSDTVDARRWDIYPTADQLYFYPTTDTGSADGQPFTIDRTGNVRAARDIYERARTTPMGHWIDVPFSAANFSAIGGGTWTLGAAAVIRNRYTLIGKTFIWSFYISWFSGSNTVAGTVTALQIAIPAGLSWNGTQFSSMAYVVEGGGVVAADANTQTPGYLSISKRSGNWAAGAVGLITTGTFEVT